MNNGARLLKSAPGSQGAKARRLDITPAMMSMLVNGHRLPGEDLRRRIETLYNVPFPAWEQGECGDDARPASGPVKPVAAPDPPSPDRGSEELSALRDGTPVERAQALLEYLSKPGRTSTELKQAAELRHALHHDAKLRGAMSTKASFEGHPDFPPWLDGLLDALAGVPGALDALSAYLNQPTGASVRKAA